MRRFCFMVAAASARRRATEEAATLARNCGAGQGKAGQGGRQAGGGGRQAGSECLWFREASRQAGRLAGRQVAGRCSQASRHRRAAGRA